MPWKYKAHFLV